MSAEQNTQSQLSVELLNYLSSRSVIKTPPDIYALPVGSILPAVVFGGRPAYKCVYSPEFNIFSVYLSDITKTTKTEETAIIDRGNPNFLHFRPSFGKNREISDSRFTVTVVGLSGREPSKSNRNAHWAFIDSIDKEG